MRNRLIMFVVFMCFSISLLSADWESFKEDVLDNVNGTNLIPAIIMAMVALIALVFMIGTSFNQPTLTLWAKEEFHHLLFSLLLLFFFISVIEFFDAAFSLFINTAVSNAISVSDTCLSYSSPRQIALCEISGMSNVLSNAILSLSQDSIQYQRDAAAYISYFGFGEGAVFSKYAYKKAWSNMLDAVVNMYVFPAYTSLISQQVFFNYVYGLMSPDSDDDPSQSIILSMLIPMALICRFFPFLRDVGNFLFALAITFYSLFPSLMSLMYAGGVSVDDCSSYAAIIQDNIPSLGDCACPYNLYVITRYYPFAFFYPNVALAISATFCMCLYNAFRRYG